MVVIDMHAEPQSGVVMKWPRNPHVVAALATSWILLRTVMPTAMALTVDPAWHVGLHWEVLVGLVVDDA